MYARVATFEGEQEHAMSPPPGPEGVGRRTGVEMFEVAVRAEA